MLVTNYISLSTISNFHPGKIQIKRSKKKNTIVTFATIWWLKWQWFLKQKGAISLHQLNVYTTRHTAIIFQVYCSIMSGWGNVMLMKWYGTFFFVKSLSFLSSDDQMSQLCFEVLAFLCRFYLVETLNFYLNIWTRSTATLSITIKERKTKPNDQQHYVECHGAEHRGDINNIQCNYLKR